MTRKQKHFCDEYITNGRDAEKAALAAGYSPKTAYKQGKNLICIPELKDKIAAELSEVYRRNHLDIDEAISILTDIGRVTKKDLLDKNGNFIPIHELPDRVAHAIEEVEYSTVYVWDDLTEQRIPKQVVKKIKLGGKQAALDKALKHLGGYKIDNEQKNVAPIQLTLNPLSDDTIDLGALPQPAK